MKHAAINACKRAMGARGPPYINRQGHSAAYEIRRGQAPTGMGTAAMGIDYKQLVIFAAFAAAGAVTGCESITGLDEFKLDSTGALECFDPTGFSGRGC